jgi:hypothetical protein
MKTKSLILLVAFAALAIVTLAGGCVLVDQLQGIVGQVCPECPKCPDSEDACLDWVEDLVD